MTFTTTLSGTHSVHSHRGRRAACTAAVAASAVLIAAPAAQAKTVTLKQGAKAVTLKVGDRLIIDLAENVSTGYAWSRTATPSIVKYLGSKYTPDPAEEGDVGVGGRIAFKYRAVKSGSGKLKLTYSRSTAAKDDPKVSVNVTVKR